MLSLTAAALIVGLASAESPELVQVNSGVLKGVVEKDVRVFKGIPYAAPPVGELRWRAPRPPAPWRGVRPAAAFEPSCIQPVTHAELPPPHPVVPPAGRTSEDCLTLNIWGPVDIAMTKRPVMVWIHGGGFYWGSGSWDQYNGAKLAREGVVVVTINYRLGAFGFFAHPTLTAESGDTPATNFGMLDMIEALRWVKRNIAAFGGDPGNVTVFGESAGGVAVDMLMVSPLAAGLFHRAIAQSDVTLPFRHLTKDRPEAPQSAEQWGLEWATKLGPGRDIEALRRLPAETILANSHGISGNAGRVIDGKSLPVDTIEGFRTGRVHKIPYLNGATDFEGALLADLGPSWADIENMLGAKRSAVMAAYDPDGSLGSERVRRLIFGDARVIRPALYRARKMNAAGVPAYSYVFAYVPASVRHLMPDGSWHGAEIPFIFDTLDTRSPAHGAPTAQDIALSAQVRAYWVNFAKTGNPGDAGGPAWRPASEGVMVFSNEGPRFTPDYSRARLQAIGDEENPLVR